MKRKKQSNGDSKHLINVRLTGENTRAQIEDNRMAVIGTTATKHISQIMYVPFNRNYTSLNNIVRWILMDVLIIYDGFIYQLI